MRISKEPEERKKEIMDTAQDLFLTKGYQKTTINDILKKIGIAKGTFYYYFQSKEEVMDAIIMRIVTREVEAAKKIAANAELSAPEKLFQIFMSEYPSEETKEAITEEIHQIENSEFHQKSLIETIRHLAPVLTEIVHQGINEKVFQTDFPQESIEFLLTSGPFLLDTGIFQWTKEEYANKASAFAQIMELVLGAKKGTFAYITELLMEDAPLDA